MKSRIQFVADYVGNDCCDWVRIKREILNSLENDERHLFSKRHNSSKKQVINTYDQEVIYYWKSITGQDLVVVNDMLHDPNHLFKKKGWGIQEYNKRRQANCEQAK
jgi:hypothetical protein